VPDERGRLLRAALGFVGLRAASEFPVLDTLHDYLDSWRGVWAVAVGMARQDFDLQLTKYAERGWRANFYPSGLAHSGVKGTAFAETRGGLCTRGRGRRCTRAHEPTMPQAHLASASADQSR
jgi:hypothetical protein